MCRSNLWESGMSNPYHINETPRLIIYIYQTKSTFPRTYRDTVGSVNTPVPFTTSNNIRTFRHALSLDERRAKFKTNVWIKHANTEESKLGPDSTITSEASPPSPVKVGSATPPSPRPNAESFDDPASLGNYSEKGLAMKDVSHGNEKNDKEGKKRNNNDHKSLNEKEDEGDESVEQEWTTDVEEVWFAVRAFLFYFRGTNTDRLPFFNLIQGCHCGASFPFLSLFCFEGKTNSF